VTISFSGSDLIIQIGDGQIDVAAQDIYSLWKDWVLLGNAQYAPAFRVVGGDPLGGGVSAGAFFFLNNEDGWRIRPESVDHELLVNGNLYGENTALPVFLPAVGDYQVLIRQNVSSLTQSIATGGSSGATAADVWNFILNGTAAGVKLSRLLDLVEADEELTGSIARLRKRGTADILLEKTVAGGTITPVTLTQAP
jgi:hypothetical protein